MQLFIRATTERLIGKGRKTTNNEMSSKERLTLAERLPKINGPNLFDVFSVFVATAILHGATHPFCEQMNCSILLTITLRDKVSCVRDQHCSFMSKFVQHSFQHGAVVRSLLLIFSYYFQVCASALESK